MGGSKEDRSEPSRKVEKGISEGRGTERVDLNKTVEADQEGESKEPSRNIVYQNANDQTAARSRSTSKLKMRRSSHSLQSLLTDLPPRSTT
jgi:hypothetical protein